MSDLLGILIDVAVPSRRRVRLFVTHGLCLQAPLSMGLPRCGWEISLAINQSFPRPPPSFARVAHRTQETCLLVRLLVYFKGY